MIQEDALIHKQIKKIMSGNLPDVFFSYFANLIVGGEVFPVRDVVSIHTLSDFSSTTNSIAKADQKAIVVRVSRSEWFTKIIPNSDNIQLTLIKKQAKAKISSVDDAGAGFVQTFEAFLPKTSDLSITGETESHESDIGGLIEIQFQLVPKDFHEFRLIERSGVFFGYSDSPLTIKTLLQGLSTVNIKTNNNQKISVDVVEPDNAKEYKQIAVDDGIALKDLPDWLQATNGIYSNGCGAYMYNGCWYVYPIHDFTRYNKTDNVLNILNVPSHDIGPAERTFVKDGKVVYLLATGHTKHVDSSDVERANRGTAFRFAIESNLLDVFSKKEAGKVLVPNNQNRVLMSLTEPSRGLIRTNTSRTKFTDNPYNEVSNLTSGFHGTITVKWTNCKTELLYPGMPVKYFYNRGGTGSVLNGTLVGINEEVGKSSMNPNDVDYETTCNLIIHCERKRNY